LRQSLVAKINTKKESSQIQHKERKKAHSLQNFLNLCATFSHPIYYWGSKFKGHKKSIERNSLKIFGVSTNNNKWICLSLAMIIDPCVIFIFN
jgi:hypothetical protein